MECTDPRPLTMSQVRACRKLDEDASDILALSLAYGVPFDEAKTYFDTMPAGVVGAALQRIFEASGLVEGAQKSA